MNSKMRTFGRAAALAGAVSLMGWIIAAQRDYQQSFHEAALVQTHPVNDSVAGVPERRDRVCVATYLGGNCRVRADRRDSPRGARPTAANIDFLLG
jgi:hypothetical protein